MSPIYLLLIGLGIVLGSILWLRLHAFLALMIGAFAVGFLTSPDYLQQSMEAKYRSELLRSAVQQEVRTRVDALGQGEQDYELTELRKQAKEQVYSESEEIETAARAKAVEFVSKETTLSRITAALGNTTTKIGLIIAMACVIGRCLLVSGSAERIVRWALGVVGERAAPIAFSASSFVLSVPVFFDSVFLLVIPLAKATWLKLRKNYLLLILALVAGGTMTHSLVPPTPGPLFVAEELGVNIGLMIIVGGCVGVCCTATGLLYAAWVNRWMQVPVRESPEALQELEELANKSQDDLPSLGMALLPVILPVVLISGATIWKSQLGPTGSLPSWMQLLGDKNVALGLSAMLALSIAAVRLGDRKQLSEQMQQALQEAGVIILICCAGGAFGAMLQQSGIGPYISSLTGSTPLDFALLPLAFLVTMVIRGAQGSATVAMFTAVAIVASLAPDLDALSYHPVYLAVGIGCGSKPFSWMNDSGFWVISRMSGMTEKETLTAHTPMVTLMGITGILVTMAAAKVFPLV